MNPGPSSVDDAVHRLVAAYRGVGATAPRPPGADIDVVLDEIAIAIHPLHLPPEVDRFWRLVDPYTLTLGPYPDLTGPRFALQTWRSHVDEPGTVPRTLFPVGYQSWGFLLVELAQVGQPGGSLLRFDYTDDCFRVRFPSLVAYLERVAAVIEADALDQHERQGRPRTGPGLFDGWDDESGEVLYGASTGADQTADVSGDPSEWPEHWVAAETSGVAGADAALTTVAAVVGQTRLGRQGTGTVRGTVCEVESSANGCALVIDDGTAALEVWCPTAVCTVPPDTGTRVEADVEVSPTAATVSRRGASDVAARATAVRPAG